MSYKILLKSMGLVAGLALSGAAFASTINVLWYTGGTQPYSGTYEGNIGSLAASMPGLPGGNTWNVTYWTSGAMPTGSFNVLVIASPEGGWSTSPDYSALQTALGGMTFGDRLMLTGQDADWHYQNTPGPSAFDGPQGFLADSINWAGSGTGLGLVALGMDGMGSACSGGPVLGLAGYSSDCYGTNSVLIPAAVAGYPINTGLSSDGLSNWSTSAHAEYFDLDPSLWIGINLDGGGSCSAAPDCYVTIISAATSGGGIGGTPVPEPAELGMFGLGALLIGAFMGLRRRFQ